jgi:hypothetical protein
MKCVTKGVVLFFSIGSAGKDRARNGNHGCADKGTFRRVIDLSLYMRSIVCLIRLRKHYHYDCPRKRQPNESEYVVTRIVLTHLMTVS